MREIINPNCFVIANSDREKTQDRKDSESNRSIPIYSSFGSPGLIIPEVAIRRVASET